jgi:hypothetical protein
MAVVYDRRWAAGSRIATTRRANEIYYASMLQDRPPQICASDTLLVAPPSYTRPHHLFTRIFCRPAGALAPLLKARATDDSSDDFP